MSTYGELITDAVRELSTLEYSDAALEAKELLGLALKLDCRSSEFEQKLWEDTDEDTEQEFFALCERRLKGEPLQYILGEWDFYGSTFKVGRGVLIPRQDTELLIDIAENVYKNSDSLEIIDLCAGSGCIGLTLERRLKNVELTMIEKYTDAIEYLFDNKLSFGSQARVVKGDVLDGSIISQQPQADLIVCNPPYLTAEDMKSLQAEVRAEPVEALYGGEDGLDFYRDIVRLWKGTLKPGGAMLFEIGASQAKEVMELMIQHGFKDVRVRKDAAGNDRAVIGFKRG
ncbi:MAG: peptide chain release factor N(5)-glutamine methyltransferase [Ruminococcus sp.]|nr:peptide chain release factor N(5)-glutamine methyltransferase [Ruminococcus sp.]